MKLLLPGLPILLFVLAAPAVRAEDKPAKQSPKEALQAFNDLIGPWRGTGTPEGTKQEKQRGFWTETMTWEWHFKDKDASIKVAFDMGKYFSGGELRYLADQDLYQFTATTPDKETLTFTGTLKERVLTLERDDDKKKEKQRLAIRMLHANRFLYQYEVKPEGKSQFARLYQVGATKEGVPFASGDGKPECIISGGAGTIPVTHNGQTYYVCCSGCRDEFKANPEKYIKEYEAAKKAKKEQKR